MVCFKLIPQYGLIRVLTKSRNTQHSDRKLEKIYTTRWGRQAFAGSSGVVRGRCCADFLLFTYERKLTCYVSMIDGS